MTFGEINVAFPIVNVEAPEEARDEVEKDATNVVAEPCLEEPWEWAPHSTRQQCAQNNSVVEFGVLYEQSSVLVAPCWVLHSNKKQ